MPSKNIQQNIVPLGKGIHRSPSVPVDGELSECVNLRPRGAELTGMPLPVDTGLELDSGRGEALACIHHVGASKHYVTIIDNWGKRKPTLRYEFVIVTEDTGVLLYTNYVSDNLELTITVNYRIGSETVRVSLTDVSCALPLVYNRRWNKIQSVSITGLPVKDSQVTTEIIDNTGNPAYVYTASSTRVARYTLAYFTDDDMERHSILDSNTTIREVLPYGNMLIVRFYDSITRALYRDGAYINLGKDMPDVNIRLALDGEFVWKSSVGTISMVDGSKSIVNYDTLRFMVSDAEAKTRNQWVSATEPYPFGASSSMALSDEQKLQRGQTYKFVNISKYDILICYEQNIQAFGSIVIPKNGSITHRMPVDSARIYYTSNGYHSERTFMCSVAVYSASTQAGDIVPANTVDNLTALMGIANDYIASAMSDKSRFVMPFFARVGLRLYDGTISRLSVPILLVPNSAATPSIIVAGDSAGNYPGIAFACQCALQYEITPDTLSNLLAWKDLIQSLVICVSAPIYTYNEGYTYESDKVNIRSERMVVVSGHAAYLDGMGFTVSRIAPTSSDASTSAAVYKTQTINSLLSESSLVPAGTVRRILLPEFDADDVRAHYTETSSFYVLEEISIDRLKSGWNTIDTAGKDLRNVYSWEVVPDDTRSHDKVSSSVMFSYNSRLHLADVTERVWRGNPVAYMTGYEQDPSSTSTFAIRAIVSISENGKTVKADTGWGAEMQVGSPYWFYYPNSNATSAQIFIRRSEDEQTYYSKADVVLTPHKLLDGAYWWESYGYLRVVECTEEEATKEVVDDTLNWPNKLYVSDTDNPWSFPVTQRISVGTGQILDLATTATALSQNPYGRSVLQAFCSDGIWELETSDTGKYLSKNPTSRDVISRANSAVMLDGAIAFPTSQGLKVLSSQGVRQLSDVIDGYNTRESDPDISEPLASFSALLGAESPLVKDSSIFREILVDAFLAYDYTYQSVHVFTGESWNYVFNFESGEWSVQNQPYVVTSVVTDYPNVYLCTQGGQVYTYRYSDSTSDITRTKSVGYALTRPLSMDNPLSRKMLYDLRTIGQYATDGSLSRIAVFASNDLLSWHPVRSLKGFSSKYYRLLIMSCLSELDTLKGVALQFVERYKGKMR